MRTILQTPRFIIREYEPDEADLLLNLHRDEQVNRFISSQTDEQRLQRFAGTLQSYQDNTGLTRWGIFNPADGDFIGTCKLMPNDTDTDKIELGYVLVRKYWGKGLATELAKALVNYGFYEKGLTDIYACVDPENAPSQNVLLKAGFERNGNVLWHNRDFLFFRIRKVLV